MLRQLRIRNFALIDRAVLSFEPGFSVITGETGSGKSILLAAINLILGERADFSVIGPDGDKAIVEADFNINQFQLHAFFQENDLDFEPETLIRREISTSGKSRAFINDTPVSLAVLRELTSKLVNIHSQYNTLELKNKAYQLEIIDILAGLLPEKEAYIKIFRKMNAVKQELDQTSQQLIQVLQQQDYNRFQLEEIEALQPDSVDFGALDVELNRLANSEAIVQTLGSVISITENDQAVMDQLRFIKTQLEKLSGTDRVVAELAGRIQSVMIELQDIVAEAENELDKTEPDPARVEELTGLLNKYNHLLRKHQLEDQQALLALRDELEASVSNAEELENKKLELEHEFRDAEKLVLEKAKILHKKRVEAVGPIVQELKEILVDLKLPHTRLEFELNEKVEPGTTGITDARMLFSANIGMELVPIDKAASGGELARVMLALQKVISAKKLLPTVLFDEIDTGVSGDVAQKIGNLLQKMGIHFQLMAISHLPQVAAKAAHQFKVEKEVEGSRTKTHVRLLNEQERVEEIARLMSGETITEAAIENAKALMK